MGIWMLSKQADHRTEANDKLQVFSSRGAGRAKRHSIISYFSSHLRVSLFAGPLMTLFSWVAT